MQMNVIVDDMLAQEPEEFAGAVVAALGGAIEFELARRGKGEGRFMKEGEGIYRMRRSTFLPSLRVSYGGEINDTFGK